MSATLSPERVQKSNRTLYLKLDGHSFDALAELVGRSDCEELKAIIEEALEVDLNKSTLVHFERPGKKKTMAAIIAPEEDLGIIAGAAAAHLREEVAWAEEVKATDPNAKIDDQYLCGLRRAVLLLGQTFDLSES